MLMTTLRYVAFAHTHTPLAYAPEWAHTSSRPGRLSIFGDTLAEVDGAVSRLLSVAVLLFLCCNKRPIRGRGVVRLTRGICHARFSFVCALLMAVMAIVWLAGDSKTSSVD
jgi:hypothetical protein